jgi:hypothetical protein
MIWPTLLLASTAVLGISGDFLMGGHFDNKNAQLTDDASDSSHLVLARTADADDLDLIAEESAASIASTPYPDQEPRYNSRNYALFLQFQSILAVLVKLCFLPYKASFLFIFSLAFPVHNACNEAFRYKQFMLVKFRSLM